MQNNLAHKKAFLRFNFQNSEPMRRVSYRFITQQNKLHSKRLFFAVFKWTIPIWLMHRFATFA